MGLEEFHDLDIVLVCGLPGSGKSHFSATYFAGKDRLRINRKELRRLLYEMMAFGDRWNEDYFDSQDEHLVKHIERRICEHLLHAGRKVLIDNTSVTASSRETYVQMARREHRSIGCIFLDTPPAVCIRRNGARPDPVPDMVITNLYSAVELPSDREGFRAVLVVHPR